MTDDDLLTRAGVSALIRRRLAEDRARPLDPPPAADLGAPPDPVAFERMVRAVEDEHAVERPPAESEEDFLWMTPSAREQWVRRHGHAEFSRRLQEQIRRSRP